MHLWWCHLDLTLVVFSRSGHRRSHRNLRSDIADVSLNLRVTPEIERARGGTDAADESVGDSIGAHDESAPEEVHGDIANPVPECLLTVSEDFLHLVAHDRDVVVERHGARILWHVDVGEVGLEELLPTRRDTADIGHRNTVAVLPRGRVQDGLQRHLYRPLLIWSEIHGKLMRLTFQVLPPSLGHDIVQLTHLYRTGHTGLVITSWA